MYVRVNQYGQFGAAVQAGSWEEYCLLTYKGDAGMIQRCNAKPPSICPLGICFPWAPPWSELGAKERGIPFGEELTRLQRQRQAVAAQQVAENRADIASSQQTVTWLAVGAGIVGVGLFLASLGGK